MSALLPQSFQQEISLTTAKIEHIFHQGEALIEKSEPLDAAVIEEELEELQRYCQEVFGRVERYYKKLIRLPVRSENKKNKNLFTVYCGLVQFQVSNKSLNIFFSSQTPSLHSIYDKFFYFLSLQMMTRRCHYRTVSWSWTSPVICAACPGVNDWGMASCHLCRPPAALPPWRLSSGPNVRAETPLPAWTPSPWSGTMTMTSAEGWRVPAGP